MLRILARTNSPEGCLAYGEYVFEMAPAPHHVEMVRAILSAIYNRQDTLILEPAGAAKTTWGNRNFLAWLISMFPNVRVGLFSETSTFAENFSRAIMTTFEGNSRHRELFGDLVNGGKWTNAEWIRKGSTVAETKDLTLFAGGTGGQVASKRFDVFLLDDILGKGNTDTIDQREKTKAWHDLALRPRGAPGAVEIALGTRWAPMDLYEEWMTPVDEGGYGFKILLRQALIDTPGAECTCGEPTHAGWASYWPDYWKVHDLLVMRSKNPAAFDCAYMNDVGGLLSGDVFQRQWYRYYGTKGGDPEEELPTGRTWTKRMGVDLASSTKERADYTARVTSAEDREGNYYVMRAWRDKIGVGHADFIVDGYAEFPLISIVRIERVQFQSTVVAEIMRDNPSVPVEGVDADGDKRVRAGAVAAKYRGQKVWHHESLRDSDFEREQLSFPKGHDDMIDAEGYSFGLGASDFFFGKFNLRGGRKGPSYERLRAEAMASLKDPVTSKELERAEALARLTR